MLFRVDNTHQIEDLSLSQLSDHVVHSEILYPLNYDSNIEANISVQK